MTLQNFYGIANELFSAVLMRQGFTSERSQRCTFHRRVSNDIYQFIVPDPASRLAWYDVKVFVSSPAIDPLFTLSFPDELGIPSDAWCYLSEEGVGLTQGRFNCKYEDNLRRRFEKTVGPLLIDVAVPYLDRIQTVDEMIPWLRRPLALGLALHHVGRTDEARPIPQQERARLMSIRDDSGELTPVFEKLVQILGEA
jgi:hypothetical protein